MEKIFPSTALIKDQPEVKHHAKEDLVRITEHGKAAYVFCSEEVYERRLSEAAEKALEEYKMEQIIERGREAYLDGRYVIGAEKARVEVAKRRKSQADG